jgi:Zn-dependent protease
MLRPLVSSAKPQGLSIMGFPLRISPFFFLLAAILRPFPQSFDEREMIELTIWIGVVTVSVLWHELGHAFTMRRFGYEPSIELTGMGGLTHWGRLTSMPTATQRIVVSLAGPFAGFAFGGLVLAVMLLVGERGHWALGEILTGLVWVNIGWGLVNLVPMVPWDGGNALHGLLDKLTNGRGQKPTAIITIALGIALLAFTALVLQQVWLSFLVILSLVAGVRMLRAPSEPVRPPAEQLAYVSQLLAKIGPETIARMVISDRADPAWNKIVLAIERDVLPREVSIAGRALALELLAWAYLLSGQADRAEEVSLRIPESHRPSAALAALISHKRSTPDQTLARAREIDGDAEAGLRAALEADALAALGRDDEAMAIAESAVDREAGSFAVEQLFRPGRFDTAARLAERLFARFSNAEDAYNAACSHARSGRPLDGLAWLERAVEAGNDQLDFLERDEDLAAVRGLPEFDRIRARLAGKTA